MRSLWSRTSGYCQVPGASPRYLASAHRCRADRIRAGKYLYLGRHREFFLGASNSQFNFPLVRVNGAQITQYATYNVLGLIARKHADLLFGERPAIKVESRGIQEKIDQIFERSQLHQVLFAAAVEASWAGETYLEIVREGAQTFIAHAPTEEIFPEGRRLANGQYASYVRCATDEITVSGRKKPLLLETRYAAGTIERQCFELDEQGNRGKAVSLDLWPTQRIDGSTLPGKEATGLDRPSIVWVPNELDGGDAVSDYDGAVELQDELNAKQTQIARVLAKHADPKMFFATGSAGNDGNIRAADDALFGDTKEAKPEYIVWQAQLDAAEADRKFTLYAICLVCETSPVLLGIKEGGAPDAARKLRLEATNSLAKAARKAAYWQPAIRLAMKLALQSEGAIVEEHLIGVEMRDGLPVDEIDRATEISTLRSAGSLSRRRSLEKQGLEPGAIEKEIAELDEETRSAMPSILMSEPGERPTMSVVNDEDEAAAVAA